MKTIPYSLDLESLEPAIDFLASPSLRNPEGCRLVAGGNTPGFRNKKSVAPRQGVLESPVK
jgi:hypothetical protein